MFLNLYEVLSELNEAKADTQNLINFAGEDLANRFLAVKNKLKAPENDLYYWIKNKTPEELEQKILEIESTKSVAQIKREVADEGAELVCDSKHWKVYRITTFEASQKYGRDTKWCITGINNWGDKYWKDYTGRGLQFYFLITKGEYDPRGTDSKIAIAVYPDNKRCEVYNQKDALIPLSAVPYISEVNLGNIRASQLTSEVRCFDCEVVLEDENEMFFGLHNDIYCEYCFEETYFICHECHTTNYVRFTQEAEDGNKYCDNCMSRSDLCTIAPGFFYEIETPERSIIGAANTAEETVDRLSRHIYKISNGDREQFKLLVLSRETGEVIYEDVGARTLKDIRIGFTDAINNYNI
jgi:hypothetical protein